MPFVPSLLATVGPGRKPLTMDIVQSEEPSGKSCRDVRDYNSEGNPTNYNEAMCPDWYVYNGRLTLHHFNNKVEIASHQNQGTRSTPAPLCG